jgi:hypothetical protein
MRLQDRQRRTIGCPRRAAAVDHPLIATQPATV